MFKIKKIDTIVLKAFVGPFFATFCISMFLFLMQFLWKWIDDLVGKGLEWHVVARLLFFSLADLIPFALPLAVLISSLMTFGNLAENFEIVALKSSGVSIYRILIPAFLVIVLLAFFTFFVSNSVIPRANLEAKSLLWDIRNKKPAFDIKEGIFYDGIDDFQIRIGKKSDDNQTIHDILIYEVKPQNSQLNTIRAERGFMKLSDDERLLYFTLYDGVRYEELTENVNYYKDFPSTVTYFDEQKMTFDLSNLDLKQTDKELFKGHASLMNVTELNLAIDSVVKEKKERQSTVRRNVDSYFPDFRILPGIPASDSLNLIHHELMRNFDPKVRHEIIENALNTTRNLKDITESAYMQLEEISDSERLFRIKWNEKYTLSFVLIVLFLIAAPLGTIIRKGGLGLPLVVSILMFIVYYVINIIGTKMGRENILQEWLGAWMASIVLLPVGIFLVYKAGRESALFDKDVYNKWIQKLSAQFSGMRERYQKK